MEEGIMIESPNLLLVEGIEDKRFFIKFADHLLLKNLQVEQYRGKDNLGRTLKAVKKRAANFRKVRCVGVMRDANSDPKAAFQSVCSHLKTCGVNQPRNPMKFVGTKPRIGVMILPGSNQKGMLEDLCLKSVQQDAAFPCVREYFQCLKEKGISFSANKLPKAEIHAFLASRDNPEVRLGEAAEKGYWDFDSEAFTQVKKFLESLASAK